MTRGQPKETVTPPPAEEDPGPGVEDGTVGDQTVVLSNWQFVDEAPTKERVLDLLGTVPDVFGVAVIDFADFVQALPQTLKIEVVKPKPTGGGTYVDNEFHESWALYMSVAGRVKMAEKIARINGWRLDFTPERETPTGIPGMLQHGDGRIVYREYAEFTQMEAGEVLHDDGGTYLMTVAGEVIGRKPGMAWVPFSGGRAAAGSNPYEKVETAARGRALGAWGIGILPGSGIASLEEMQGIAANQRAMAAEGGGGGDSRVVEPGQQRKPKDELVGDAMTLAEEVRQASGLDEDTMLDQIVSFLADRLMIRSVFDAEARQIDWAKVKPGQVQLLVNALADRKSKIVSEGAL